MAYRLLSTTIALDDLRRTHGGPNWEQLIVASLRAFMALALYMGLKCQPNYKTYWSNNTLFYCPMVANIFTRERFMALWRLLHVTNAETYVHIQCGDAMYDKLCQTRWLVDAICERCQAVWNLEKFITIDEMMIRYKGS